jgi:hypothetical protein
MRPDATMPRARGRSCCARTTGSLSGVSGLRCDATKQSGKTQGNAQTSASVAAAIDIRRAYRHGELPELASHERRECPHLPEPGGLGLGFRDFGSEDSRLRPPAHAVAER